MNNWSIDSNHSSFIIHHSFLQRCIELARVPGAAVEPNPRVGALVVWNEKIIGEGAHEFYGGPHAEVNVIASVQDKSLLQKSTLYVSLEPCNHHGKTPPCTELILEMGIRHVVVGSVDPNPQMSGKSIAYLRSKGVQVDVLEDQREFVDLNQHFWVNQRQQRPYIVLKWAESTDGLISGTNSEGNPEPRAISCPEVNRHFHWLRHELQAIWIGKNTALVDNPSLTTRLWPGRSPVRIVFDRHLDLPNSLNFFQGGTTIVINGKKESQEGNVHFWKVDETQDLPKLLTRMYQELKIGSILVEGGQNLTQQFLDLELWDEIYRAISPQKFGQGVAAPKLPNPLTTTSMQQIGIDALEWYDHFSNKP